MTREQLQHEIETIRAKRLRAEREVDEYERRATRACRRGQAMHVEQRVKEMELEMVTPLYERERELTKQLEELEAS